MKIFTSILKLIFNLISWLFLGVFVLMGIFTISSNTDLFGGYKSFLVLSGSMEPTINIGDIIIIHKQDQYVINDVVTFTGSSGRLVTHRIIGTKEEQNTRFFVTRGDANRTEDDERIGNSDIKGKTVLVIPKIGYLVNFSKSVPGLIILIVVPIALLIFDSIYKYLMSKYSK